MGKEKSARILCVANAGGHLTEMLVLADSLGIREKATFLTDRGTADKLFQRAFFVKGTGKIRNIPGDTIRILKTLFIVRPKVIISTGAEIGLITGILGKLFFHSKLVYVECSAQVQNKSYSGRFIYPFADLFYVQWKPLLKKYGKKAEYAGNLILGEA